ncbi:amidase [Vineibacter terrae]|uniref:amidase n=1 Tax=Vineibacter terrae TaxID=2586908 RepID=UPI002E3378A0|nr:amidase [Vineibacter terrae]HEX2890552.1 amidase [Vineibacter terrae]
MSDWATLDLTAAAAAIADGRVSSVELTQACLARIEAWQPRTNAFIRLDRDAALATARDRDLERGAGRMRGKLHGVPLAHKDMFYRQGRVSTGGSAIRRDWIADRTATVNTRLDAAGAIDLGTLNMAEFAAGPTGHNIHFGDCCNPWDPARVTGGSSSGSAAAVAARMIFGALGSDTGGSIRMPAAICGVVGMKPTYGRVSRFGALPRSWSLDHVGPLTRSVADNARLLQVIAGADDDDAAASGQAVPDYEAMLDRPIAGLRLGVPQDAALDGVDSDVTAALAQARRDLQQIGVTFVDVRLPELGALFDSAETIIKCEAAAMHRPWLEARPQDYANQVRWRMEAGFLIPATQYIDALRLRTYHTQEFIAGTLDGIDALLLPTMPFATPTRAETDVERRPGATALAILSRFSRFTRPFNLLGLPALSLPCGRDANGLPIGLQLVGRPFAEATLYTIGHAYQQATDHHRQAPVLQMP